MTLLESVKTSLEIVTITTVIFFTLYKFFIRKWYQAYKKNEESHKEDLVQKIEMLGQQMKLVKHKLFPNGGTSIDDKLEKTMSKLHDIEININNLHTGQRNIFDILEVASWESDNKGSVTYVSSGVCDILNCIPDELLGNSWVGKIHPAQRENVVREWKSAVENGSEFNLNFIVKYSDTLWQNVNSIAIHNKDKTGKVVSSIGRLTKIGNPYKIEKDDHGNNKRMGR